MSDFSGVYYDGRSTFQATVTVRIDEKRGVLEVSGGEAPLAYLLTELRITPRVASTPTSILLPSGALCEVEDSASLDAAFRRARQRRPGTLIHELQSRPQYVAACTALLVSVCVFAVFWGIPLAARRLADTLPDKVAETLGRGTLEALDKLALKPSELPEYRRKLLEGAFLDMARDYPELPLRLHFRSGRHANAFALPDGSIILLDELVTAAHRDQEIMAVLAHEIGHVKNRDGLRTVLESTGMAMLFAAYLADLAQLTTFSAGLPTALLEARFSREQEAAADAFALEHLRRAGIQPYHMAEMLRTLQARSGAESKGAVQYLDSHPLTSERIALFEGGTEDPVREMARLIEAKNPLLYHVRRALFDVIEREPSRWDIVITEVREPHAGLRLTQTTPALLALDSEFSSQPVPLIGKPLSQLSTEEIDALNEAQMKAYKDHFFGYLSQRESLYSETLLGLLGLRAFDIVTSIDGVPVSTAAAAPAALAHVRDARTLELEIRRGGETLTIGYIIE